MRSKIASLIDSITDRVDWLTLPRQRARRDAEAVVEWIVRTEDLESIRYPSFYVEFMRQWHERWSLRVGWIKREHADGDVALRFTTFVDTVQSQVPVPPLHIARAATRVADDLLELRDGLRFEQWAGDVGMHFWISSSLARKGRLLCAMIRFLRPARVLEVGTAYGMSACFMGQKLERVCPGWSVVTIEMSQQIHAIASAMLGRSFGHRMRCIYGASGDVLGTLAGSHFDFVFHDGAHSFEAYVSDFAAIEPLLPAGAVLLLDDIHWEDERFHAGTARTYEGWREIVRHPRVALAVELDESMGLLLMR